MVASLEGRWIYHLPSIICNQVMAWMAKAATIVARRQAQLSVAYANPNPNLNPIPNPNPTPNQAGRPKEAGKWLQRMLDSNVNPDTIACNAVLLAHANAGDADGACHLPRQPRP